MHYAQKYTKYTEPFEVILLFLGLDLPAPSTTN